MLMENTQQNNTGNEENLINLVDQSVVGLTENAGRKTNGCSKITGHENAGHETIHFHVLQFHALKFRPFVSRPAISRQHFQRPRVAVNTLVVFKRAEKGDELAHNGPRCLRHLVNNASSYYTAEKGILSQYISKQPGQLSLPSLWGRQIECWPV